MPEHVDPTPNHIVEMYFQQRRTSRTFEGRARGNNEGEESVTSPPWRPASTRAGSTDSVSADVRVKHEQTQQRGSMVSSWRDQHDPPISSRRRPRQTSKPLRKRQPSLVFYILLSITGVFILNGAYVLTRMPSSSIVTGPQSTVSSKRSYPRGRRAQGIHASETPSEEDGDWLLSRMISAQSERRDECARENLRFDLNGTGLASSSRRLRPFGLRLDLMNYHRTVHSSMGHRNASDAPRTCRFINSSSQACKVSSYAIIATSVDPLPYDSAEDAELALKTIVLNCLQWLLDPGAGEVWILLSSHAESALKLPTFSRGYMSRLWEWNSTRDHPVKLLFVSDLWTGIDAVYRRTREVVVVWRSASHAFRGSVNETQTGLRLWRESPVRLYASRTLSLSSSARSQCGFLDKSETGRAKVDGTQLTTAWILPDLADGLMHHICYLCFAEHPVMERVRFALAASNEAQSSGHWRSLWYESMLGISLWLAHASSSGTTSSPGHWLQLYASQDVRTKQNPDDPSISNGGVVGEADETWAPGSRTYTDLLSYFGGIPKLLVTGETPRSSSTACGI
jgi:hypothetical protein